MCRLESVLCDDVLFAGVSGEVVQLDVGHCQKKRCLSLLSLMDPDVADFDSSVFKVSFISHALTSCPETKDDLVK